MADSWTRAGGSQIKRKIEIDAISHPKVCDLAGESMRLALICLGQNILGLQVTAGQRNKRQDQSARDYEANGAPVNDVFAVKILQAF